MRKTLTFFFTFFFPKFFFKIYRFITGFYEHTDLSLYIFHITTLWPLDDFSIRFWIQNLKSLSTKLTKINKFNSANIKSTLRYTCEAFDFCRQFITGISNWTVHSSMDIIPTLRRGHQLFTSGLEHWKVNDFIRTLLYKWTKYIFFHQKKQSI